MELIDALWTDYLGLNPHAATVHEALTRRGEIPVNDHIALRTFDDDRCNIDIIARPFLEAGYLPKDEYSFEEKKLFACHLECHDLPKVFISQLELGRCSTHLQQIVSSLLTGLTEVVLPSRPWRCSYTAYQTLAAESEYAAWLAAFGFRANHFTIDVDSLNTFDDLPSLNVYLRMQGIELNESGGLIKGSPQEFLEQSSTLAGKTPVEFTDGTHQIPACYYEFARRYVQPDGTRFEGFVPDSADRLFESTNRR